MGQIANAQDAQGAQDTRDAQSVAAQVVDAVADATGDSVLSLDPLYEVVDPDALESLFQVGTTGRVEFVYEGCEVVVHADGDVDVAAPGR
jgi:ethanolamine ammonia-lyase large subunit